MKIKERAGSILLVLITSMFMTVGCNSERMQERREQQKEYTEQGRENALNYIEAKYGFEAEVLSIECDKNDSFFYASLNGIVYVQMEYEDNEFYVKIRGDQITTEGYDNYQAGEIRDAFAKRMEEMTGLHAEQIKMLYGEERSYDPESMYYGLVNTYFDGNNLSEIFEGSRKSYDNRVVVSVIDQDISGLPYEEIQEAFGESTVYLFADYRSEPDYALMGDDQIRAIWGFPVTNNVDQYALFIKDYVQLEKDNIEYKEYILNKHDDIYYVLENGTYIEFKRTTMSNAMEWKGHGFLDPVQVYDAYEIDTDASAVHIWLAYEDIGYTAEDTVNFAFQRSGSDTVSAYSNGLTFEIGQDEYMYTKIYMRDYKNFKFSIFLEEGK